MVGYIRLVSYAKVTGWVQYQGLGVSFLVSEREGEEKAEWKRIGKMTMEGMMLFSILNQKVPTNIASRGAERARYLADTEFRTSPDREH
jgi:hypothetical protein